jgi:dihydroorotate dehydrogenase electron transfer subunit
MRIKSKIVSNTKIGSDLWRLKLDAGKSIKARPGQFINLLISESYQPLLRRPFSIYDAYGKYVEIVYKVIGCGTRLLSEKKKGDVLDFMGPLGNSYLDHMTGSKSPIVLIGGGTGAASVFFLAKYLKSKKIKFTFIQGAKCRDQMVARAEFKKLGCAFATDDGSMGNKGFASDVLKDVLKDDSIIFTCGPKPMFKAIKAVADTKNFVKVFASFEEYMGCGIGACVSCVLEIKTGDTTEYKRVCKDGTIFDLNDVEF